MKKFIIKVIKSFLLNLFLHYIFFTVIMPMAVQIAPLRVILLLFTPSINILCNVIEVVNETGYCTKFTDSDLGLIIGNIILLVLSAIVFKGDSSWRGQLLFAGIVYPLILNFTSTLYSMSLKVLYVLTENLKKDKINKKHMLSYMPTVLLVY